MNAKNAECRHENMKLCDDCGKPMCADCGAACACDHEESMAESDEDTEM